MGFSTLPPFFHLLLSLPLVRPNTSTGASGCHGPPTSAGPGVQSKAHSNHWAIAFQIKSPPQTLVFPVSGLIKAQIMEELFLLMGHEQVKDAKWPLYCFSMEKLEGKFTD
jgi:hypothetical protein